jgi:hypothetical protein
MRYHWGHAVGHVYAHQQQCTNAGVIWSDTNHSRGDPEELSEPSNQTATEELHELRHMDRVDFGPGSGTDGSDSDSEDEDWKPSDTDDNQSSDDEYLLDIDEMYGEGGLDDGYEG